jgi:hypothetical protein
MVIEWTMAAERWLKRYVETDSSFRSRRAGDSSVLFIGY